MKETKRYRKRELEKERQRKTSERERECVYLYVSERNEDLKLIFNSANVFVQTLAATKTY